MFEFVNRLIFTTLCTTLWLFDLHVFEFLIRTSLIFILPDGITDYHYMSWKVLKWKSPAQAPPLESQSWEFLIPPCGVLLSRRFSGWPCCKWWMTSTWGPNYWNQWNWYDMCKSWAGYIFSSPIISPFNKLNITCQNAFAFYLVSFKSPNETLIY